MCRPRPLPSALRHLFVCSWRESNGPFEPGPASALGEARRVLIVRQAGRELKRRSGSFSFSSTQLATFSHVHYWPGWLLRTLIFKRQAEGPTSLLGARPVQPRPLFAGADSSHRSRGCPPRVTAPCPLSPQRSPRPVTNGPTDAQRGLAVPPSLRAKRRCCADTVVALLGRETAAAPLTLTATVVRTFGLSGWKSNELSSSYDTQRWTPLLKTILLSTWVSVPLSSLSAPVWALASQLLLRRPASGLAGMTTRDWPRDTVWFGPHSTGWEPPQK